MRGRQHKLQVSTFPFLAVLLCAMGSLILVLLVMDRKAHKAAQARALREAARLVEESARKAALSDPHQGTNQQARQDWEQKRKSLHEKLTREQIELQLQMRKVREELQRIAARLHYEQDTTTQLRRKVQDKHNQLQAEEQLLRSLHANAKQTQEQSKESSQTLRRMTLDLLQMEQVLKDLKTSRQREQKTFSVVPYHGRRGENRRPIYVECTADGVIFHPERKAMPLVALIPRSSDMSSDVRDEVERRITQQRQKLAALPNSVDKTPYLLLLLRPSGVSTYHLFQRALRGLPLDFGYEFIDEDWVLDFPVDDELPSTQPWMIATKTPARPPAAASVLPPPSPQTSARPLGGLPMGASTGALAGGLRGFRAGEASGSGSLVKGDANQPGPAANGPGGGARPAIAGGGGTAISNTQIALANEGKGSVGHWSEPGASVSGQSGPLAYVHRPDSANYGNGRGHPSAKPPAFPGDESGTSNLSEGGASGNGHQGPKGAFRWGGPNSGPGPGPGFSVDGSLGGPGGDLPGLGPPRALASLPGKGQSGGLIDQNGIVGTDPINTVFPGKGGVGAGMGGAGVPGTSRRIGVSGEGRYVIARGNNGDVPTLPFNGGEGVIGEGGRSMSGASGNGGPSFGTTNEFRSNPGGQAPEALPMGTRATSGGSFGGEAIAETPPPGVLPSGGLSTGAIRNNGFGPSGQGPGSIPTVSGQTPYGNGGATGMGGTAAAGASGSGGQSSPGTQLSGSQAPVGNEGNVPNSGAQGAGSPSPGPGTPPPVAASALSGVPNGQAGGGAPMPANGGRSSEVVVFVDPITGKPTTAPPPAPPPDEAPSEAPPQGPDGNRGGRRIRVVPATPAASNGSYATADDAASAMNRFAPTPSLAPPPRRMTASRPAWLHGGRDWTIYVECRANDVILYPSQQSYTLAQAVSPTAGNPLLKAIQQMIDRRQSLRRPDEPPFHPQVCLLVRPEHIRTFLNVYPALEALPVPKTRRNLDADDDVISIVTGAVP